MKYNIVISYSTGDSNGSHDDTQFMDGEWENKEIIKENLERIKEHYKWYEYTHIRFGKEPVEEPNWHKGLPEYSVLFKTDQGVEYMQSAYWCGYFETLYGAKAVPVKEEEIGFEL